MQSESYTSVEQVMKHIRDGKYVIMSCTAHQAYIGREASLNRGTPVVLDSGGWTSCHSSLAVELNGYNRATFTTIYVYTVGKLPGSIDINGCLDGIQSSTLGSQGTFDVYINNNCEANDVNDFNKSYSSDVSYFITDIKANPGYDYLGFTSGSDRGTISAGNKIVVQLNFATQGHLYVEGKLDGISDSSIENYGTFDVYINGQLDASNCTVYNKKWPKGTTYEVKNIQAEAGKNYSGQTSFTGTITSKTESKVTLPFTTDGTATPEWQTGKVVPGNLILDTLDIEYKHHYEKVSTTSPGTGWVQAGVHRTYYQNSGSVEEYPYEKATSDAYVYVGGYYYHWCGSNNDCNYQKTPGKYETYHGNNSLDAFDVVKVGVDTNNAQVNWYSLKWKAGQVYSGAATCATNQTSSWYRMYQYQPRKLITEYLWTKDTDWTSAYDSSATSYSVRWRLKDGVPTEYKGLELKFVVDGESVASLDGIASLDVYINGEMKAENATSFRSFFPGSFGYEIQLTSVADNKLYKRIEGGELFGTVEEELKTLTLYFDTGVQAEEDWKEIPDELLPYIDEHTEVEYRHTYTQTGRTSPGDGWTMIQQGAVQYENSGAPYESDNELTTSATRALVGYYYFHWCNYGEVANYYQKDYLPVRHAISMDLMSHFSAVEKGTDGDGSGRKYYYLTHLDGEYAGSTAKCSTNGAVVYYRGAVYQDKVAYRINTYQKIGDWTTVLDTTATSVEYRVRLKQYPVKFDAAGGTFDVAQLTKYSGKDLILPTEVPTRDLHEFVAWNTSPDGTGTAYLPGVAYTADEAVTLYARWREIDTLALPASLSVIEEEAFAGVSAAIIYVPSSCMEIQSRAFADCSSLQRIYISAATESIALDAFDGCTNLTVYAPTGSVAIKVAKYNDLFYVETDAP